MTDTTVAGGAPFRVGGCLSKSLSAFFGNFVAFNVMGLAIIVPGAVLVMLLFGSLFSGLYTYDPALGGPPPEFGAGAGAAIFATSFIMLALQYLLTGVVVYGALQHLQGQKPSVAKSLAQGLRRFLPIIIVAIISLILIWIGMILLIVPGIIIALMICVAIPVLMVEGPGIFASLSRSRQLTKGSRWRLLGLFLVAFIGTTVASLIISTVAGVVLVFAGGAGVILSTIINVALQVFVTVFLAVVLAVAYHDLRVAKEGVSTAQIAAVFD